MYKIEFEVYGTVSSQIVNTMTEAQELIDMITKRAHRALFVFERVADGWNVIAYNKYVNAKNINLFNVDEDVFNRMFTRVVYKTHNVNWHPYLSRDLAMSDYKLIADRGVPVYLVDHDKVALKANLGEQVRA